MSGRPIKRTLRRGTRVTWPSILGALSNSRPNRATLTPGEANGPGAATEVPATTTCTNAEGNGRPVLLCFACSTENRELWLIRPSVSPRSA